MIKYYHEATKKEIDALIGKITWGQLATDYPQPKWCSYPDAVYGDAGCWSLVGHRVTGKKYCNGCEFYSLLEGERGNGVKD